MSSRLARWLEGASSGLLAGVFEMTVRLSLTFPAEIWAIEVAGLLETGF
ncbi:MAG TPA: hypothetical protein VEZ90_19910 [Blastocatellia bacterium]|nr:hypothetical protein [Blastocatellia bacterium]